jgi:hypothetical protein
VVRYFLSMCRGWFGPGFERSTSVQLLGHWNQPRHLSILA